MTISWHDGACTSQMFFDRKFLYSANFFNAVSFIFLIFYLLCLAYLIFFQNVGFTIEMQIFVEVWCFSLTIPQGFSVKSSVFI